MSQLDLAFDTAGVVRVAGHSRRERLRCQDLGPAVRRRRSPDTNRPCSNLAGSGSGRVTGVRSSVVRGVARQGVRQ